MSFERLLVASSNTRAVKFEDKGWRLRIWQEHDDDVVHLYEEQVLPERVGLLTARRFRAQNEITMNNTEMRWVRDQLSELLGEFEDVEALKAEIQQLRAITALR